MTNTVQKAVRLSRPILARIATVLEAMEKDPRYNWARVTEVGVMRLAIVHGLTHLEKQLKAKKQTKDPQGTQWTLRGSKT
jgi:hypothetical protein